MQLCRPVACYVICFSVCMIISDKFYNDNNNYKKMVLAVELFIYDNEGQWCMGDLLDLGKLPGVWHCERVHYSRVEDSRVFV